VLLRRITDKLRKVPAKPGLFAYRDFWKNGEEEKIKDCNSGYRYQLSRSGRSYLFQRTD
jgi:hypothetical protein